MTHAEPAKSDPKRPREALEILRDLVSGIGVIRAHPIPLDLTREPVYVMIATVTEPLIRELQEFKTREAGRDENWRLQQIAVLPYQGV